MSKRDLDKIHPETIHFPQNETVGIGLGVNDLIELKKIIASSGTVNPKLLALQEHMSTLNAEIIWSQTENQEPQIVAPTNSIESILPPETTFSGLNDLALLVRVYEAVKSKGTGDLFIPMINVVKKLTEASGLPEEEVLPWFYKTVERDANAQFYIISIEKVRGKVGDQFAVLDDRLRFGNPSAPKERVDEYRSISRLVDTLESDVFNQEVKLAINRAKN